MNMENVILGFGAMRLPQKDSDNPASIDMDELTEMVDYYMQQGFDYFDTSYAYHNQESENALKKVLVERYPRESYRIADKIPTWLLTDYKDNQKYVDEMLSRLGIDYFDVLLIHNINSSFLKLAENAKSFEFIGEIKRKGLARKVGFSFHDTADLLEEVLEKYSEYVDVVQIQLNYLDWKDQRIQAAKCHRLCMKYEKEIIVMEPVKGGMLVNIPDSVKEQFREYDSSKSVVDWALKFAASQRNVSTVLSGMSSLSQTVENCRTFADIEKITSDERRFLMRMADEIKKTMEIQCSFCSYCVKDCEMNIPIPVYFSIYNNDKIYHLPVNKSIYDTNSAKFNPASACSECGTCVDMCTQQLDIPSLLKDVAGLFEDGQ